MGSGVSQIPQPDYFYKDLKNGDGQIDPVKKKAITAESLAKILKTDRNLNKARNELCAVLKLYHPSLARWEGQVNQGRLGVDRLYLKIIDLWLDSAVGERHISELKEAIQILHLRNAEELLKDIDGNVIVSYEGEHETEMKRKIQFQHVARIVENVLMKDTLIDHKWRTLCEMFGLPKDFYFTEYTFGELNMEEILKTGIERWLSGKGVCRTIKDLHAILDKIGLTESRDLLRIELDEA